MSSDQPFSQRVQQAQRTLAELPEPDSAAQAHSQQLITLIKERITQQGGAITFHDFMQLALHAPGLGYYSAGSRKLGKEGDFITAPETYPLFSR